MSKLLFLFVHRSKQEEIFSVKHLQFENRALFVLLKLVIVLLLTDKINVCERPYFNHLMFKSKIHTLNKQLGPIGRDIVFMC